MTPRKTRIIELYIGYTNGSDAGTWTTDTVDIPIDTPKEKIASVACAAMKKKQEDEGFDNVAFMGVYNIPDPDEDAEEE